MNRLFLQNDAQLHFSPNSCWDTTARTLTILICPDNKPSREVSTYGNKISLVIETGKSCWGSNHPPQLLGRYDLFNDQN